MKLLRQQYGKARVRVMKVTRHGEQHALKELEISVLLQGDFESSYTEADNKLVVPTDTMKNTVNILAKEHLGGETEAFGLVVGRHFLKKISPGGLGADPACGTLLGSDVNQRAGAGAQFHGKKPGPAICGNKLFAEGNEGGIRGERSADFENDTIRV